MPFEFLVSALVTLLVVVDPVGLVPSFLTTTNGLPATLRRRVAVRACLIAGAILIGTALIGDWLLRQLGITLPAFRIAGGLLLFAVAFEMVLGLRLKRDTRTPSRRSRSTPTTWRRSAGDPADGGARRHHRDHPAGRSGRLPAAMARGAVAVVVVVMAACLIAFLAAERIGKLLGVTGNVVLSRLLGVILAALAVQYVVDGVRAAFGF